MTTQAPEPRPGGSRAQFLAIVAIAVASLLAACALFAVLRGGSRLPTSNRGTFVDPPMTVEALVLRRSDGTAFDPAGAWWLWVVPGGPCAATCDAALHELRQLHVLLNRDAVRVRRALVSNDPGDERRVRRYRRLQVLSGNLAGLERGVYIVDPHGNLVLRYPLADPGEAVLDDLERLLKVSQIG